MSATFPNAKKTFSAVVNGVTKLVAALFNAGYDEIEAIETFLGPTGGGAQSYYTSLTDMLISYRRGCAVEYKGDADLYVRAGEIMIVDASGNRRLRRNPSDTTVTWSDIDTGSEATSTQYYIYACADNNATTFTVVISTNATTPTGMTFYRRIGSFYNNASGNISIVNNSLGVSLPQARITSAVNITTTESDIEGLAVNVVPKSASSKFLITATIPIGGSAGSASYAIILCRDTTKIHSQGSVGNGSEGRPAWTTQTITWLDAPATTSPIVYKIRAHASSNGIVTVAGTVDGYTTDAVINVLEIE